MKLLEERIAKDGKVFPGNILKVDSFLNHQIDVSLLCKMGKEIKRLYNAYSKCSAPSFDVVITLHIRSIIYAISGVILRMIDISPNTLTISFGT